MSINLHDITLESMDGTLVSRNEHGHLTEPMLFLDREPTPDDAQGWDQVLVFVDGDVRIPGGETVKPMIIELNEENGYAHSLDIAADTAWTLVGVQSSQIQVTPASGTGDTTITLLKSEALTQPGEYKCIFAVLGASDEVMTVVLVHTTLSIPLEVRYGTASTYESARNGEEITVTFSEDTSYGNELITVIRDQQWEFNDVDTSKLSVSPTSGAGQQMSIPPYSTQVTISKAASYIPSGFEDTECSVVSGNQRVKIIVPFTPHIEGEFVNPDPEEEGVTGTEPVYIHI